MDCTADLFSIKVREAFVVYKSVNRNGVDVSCAEIATHKLEDVSPSHKAIGECLSSCDSRRRFSPFFYLVHFVFNSFRN